MNATVCCPRSASAQEAQIGGREGMVRFTVSPTPAGEWLWRVFEHDGRTRVQGLAASRKHAAALIIHDILRSHSAVAALTASEPPAKAA